MNSQIINENIFLIYSILTGILMTLTYDFLRIFRRVFSHHWFFVSLEDLVFWLLCGISVFLLLQRESNGILRWFAILGALLGMFLYRQCVGRYLVPYLSKVLNHFKEKIKKPFKILLKRARKSGRFLENFCERSYIFLRNRLTRILKTIKIILCKH